MTRNLFLLVLLSVAISALAQIALKSGMASSSVQRSMALGLRPRLLFDVACSPMVVFGLFLYFGSAAVWLSVLARVDVSLAYPFVALGFIFTAVLGRLLFGDPFTTGKVLGTLLIVTGVAVISRG